MGTPAQSALPLQPIERMILSAFDQLERSSLDLHALFEVVAGNQPADREAVLDAAAGLVRSALLREEGGDFYRRTEDGRLAVARPREITLYTRHGCHLCDEAKAVILPLLHPFAASFREVDVDEDPVLQDRYTNDVPVIFIGSRMVAQHRADPEQLRQELRRGAEAQASRD